MYKTDRTIEWGNSLTEDFGFLKLSNEDNFFFFGPIGN